MKKFVMFLFLSVLTMTVSLATQSLGSDTIVGVSNNVVTVSSDSIEQSVFESIEEACLEFIGMVNWMFVIVFIIVAWLVNDTAESTNSNTSWLNWWAKIPKVLRTLIIGILLMGLFIWAFRYHTREDIVQMIFGIITSMVIYKIGLNKILRWFASKIGFKFE